MEPQDRTLARITRAQSGDRKAFDELVEKYRARIDALVDRRLGDALRQKVQTEDVLQETLLRAFESMARFQWIDDDSFVRWLGGIAGHVIQEIARLNKRRPVTSLKREVPAQDPSQGKVLRRNERFERLQEALNTLSPDYRRVIVLARVERLPLKEVARRMSRSRQAVRQMLWRALLKLKAAFGDTESLHLPQRSLKEDGARDA